MAVKPKPSKIVIICVLGGFYIMGDPFMKPAIRHYLNLIMSNNNKSNPYPFSRFGREP
jgi:hypothetical protein